MGSSKRLKAKRSTAKRPDARALLRSELEAVNELLDQFENSRSTTQKKAIVQEICLALTVHAQLADEIVYPALKHALSDNALVPKAREQLAILKSLIDEVQGGEPDDDDYDANVRMISQHVKERVDQHREMFPKARRHKLDMGALGAQLASRKQELLAARSDFGGWD